MCGLTQCRQAIHWGKTLAAALFKTNNLGHLILLAVMTSTGAGVLLFLIDPNIHSPLDGIWGAWVTMTHVGFGDVVPVSFLGRLLAAALILFGLVFFALFTALVSVALIGRNIEPLAANMRHIEQEAGDLETGEARIMAELARLHARMAALEQQLLATTSPPASDAENAR